MIMIMKDYVDESMMTRTSENSQYGNEYTLLDRTKKHK